MTATFGPTGMKTPLEPMPSHASGAFCWTCSHACSWEAAAVAEAGIRSYWTVQPFFSRSFTASFTPSSKLLMPSGDSPLISYAPMTNRSFFPRVCASTGLITTPTDANVAAATATTMADLSLLKALPPISTRARTRESGLLTRARTDFGRAPPRSMTPLRTSVEMDSDLLAGQRRFLSEV